MYNEPLFECFGSLLILTPSVTENKQQNGTFLVQSLKIGSNTMEGPQQSPQSTFELLDAALTALPNYFSSLCSKSMKSMVINIQPVKLYNCTQIDNVSHGEIPYII